MKMGHSTREDVNILDHDVLTGHDEVKLPHALKTLSQGFGYLAFSGKTNYDKDK